MRYDKKPALLPLAAVILLIFVIGVYVGAHFATVRDEAPRLGFGTSTAKAADSGTPVAAPEPPKGAADQPAEESLDLSPSQLATVELGPIGSRDFPVKKGAYGNIDYNEDLEVQVFTPYQGRIIDAFGKLGDEVKRGQTLFTIESPDLIQAESNLIAAAGVLDLTSRALKRAKELYAVQAMAQKDMEQAVSDQQTADGTLKAARDAVLVFGKSEADMDRMIKQRKVDRSLIVPSPIAGRITARNAQPGLFVQPGNPPAPYTVADLSTVWMVANVAETDSTVFRAGQAVKVTVMALPGRSFEGRITRLATGVDPTIHRLMVRSEVEDPQHELRPGMFASFDIDTGKPVNALAVPLDGVVREGDGTMSVWVTTDRRHFVKRTVKLGLQHDGFDEVVDGLRAGETIVTKGAVFLSNMLTGGPS
jgi:membrane fusion protein, heavy metal efflux system